MRGPQELRDKRAKKRKSIEKDLEVKIVVVKDRFMNPTPDGWADMLVNFVFPNSDCPRHVMELQLQHKTLMNKRERGSGHETCGDFRALADILSERSAVTACGGGFMWLLAGAGAHE